MLWLCGSNPNGKGGAFKALCSGFESQLPLHFKILLDSV